MLETGKIENVKVQTVKIQGAAQTSGAESPALSEKPEPAKFDDLTREPLQQKTQNLDFILDIPLEVTVELGRTKMMVNDLLQLGQGSVVELEKLAGEPVEVLVNEKLIARGEVVVVNEKFGVRFTDIISPLDRIKQLK